MYCKMFSMSNVCRSSIFTLDVHMYYSSVYFSHEMSPHDHRMIELLKVAVYTRVLKVSRLPLKSLYFVSCGVQRIFLNFVKHRPQQILNHLGLLMNSACHLHLILSQVEKVPRLPVKIVQFCELWRQEKLYQL